ncbi:hypothetical protein QT381_08525 [Galbitalea sp. SE-J8]|uniref:hypothetical protein n=1 Tax=Galbitalea sp. SE-J8 TaxID=3054952 RepID=UPI00259D18AE|nr:hypothetical protein [Galbitalea sp. SE-J8]MDM4763051.1 hypothetical protein [Galbitalea sp. SE-J8]
MGSPTATVLSIVGERADSVIRELAPLPNVSAFAGADAADASERSARATATYVVHDADPLRHVAAAWVEFYDDRSTLGVLELEIAEAVRALGEGGMPDYYVVLHPESIEGTWRHWWLGVLAAAAPTRVLPAEDAASVRRLMRRLPAGRPWPEPTAWLRDVPYAIPDRIGLTA